MRSLLDCSPMLRSRDAEETRAFLAAKALALDPVRPYDGAPLDVRLNGVFLSGLWLGYFQYGAPVSVWHSPQSNVWLDHPRHGALARHSGGDYWIHLPLHGGFESAIGSHQIVCDSRRGLVTSPSDVYAVHTEPASTRLGVSIRGDVMTQHLGAMLGDAPSKPLQFTWPLALNDGSGRSLARFLRSTAIDFCERDELLCSPLAAPQFEQFVIARLLLSQPHNYTQALRLRERPIAPRDVRRAIEYIHENITEPIALADLVAVSGVAGRTLFQHFRDFHGVTPMRYVRNLRLQRVREELSSGKVDRVTDAALKWGLEHAGRFSVEYRRRFGEAPSATLARCRATSK